VNLISHVFLKNLRTSLHLILIFFNLKASFHTAFFSFWESHFISLFCFFKAYFTFFFGGVVVVTYGIHLLLKQR
jgi:hypothetical protein